MALHFTSPLTMPSMHVVGRQTVGSLEAVPLRLPHMDELQSWPTWHSSKLPSRGHALRSTTFSEQMLSNPASVMLADTPSSKKPAHFTHSAQGLLRKESPSLCFMRCCACQTCRDSRFHSHQNRVFRHLWQHIDHCRIELRDVPGVHNKVFQDETRLSDLRQADIDSKCVDLLPLDTELRVLITTHRVDSRLCSTYPVELCCATPGHSHSLRPIAAALGRYF